MPLIVFDLDGTLIDSRIDLANAANALIEELGGAPQPVEAITGMVGEGARLLVRRALAAAGLAADEEAALARFLELYDERLLVHTVMYPGTRDLLDRLAADTQLAVLTNKPQHHTDRILDGLGIARYFAHVVGGDTPLGRKPDPAGLRHLLALTGTPDDESVMVGDSAIDLRTARAAGIRICLVRYGFGFPLAARELAGDELVADAPVNVADLIRGRAPGRQRS